MRFVGSQYLRNNVTVHQVASFNLTVVAASVDPSQCLLSGPAVDGSFLSGKDVGLRLPNWVAAWMEWMRGYYACQTRLLPQLTIPPPYFLCWAESVHLDVPTSVTVIARDIFGNEVDSALAR